MKKLLMFLAVVFTASAFAQNQEVVYESIYLIPEKANEMNLLKVLKSTMISFTVKEDQLLLSIMC